MVDAVEQTTSRSAAETEAFGEGLGRRLTGGDVVLLNGELAAGKTTMVRGLLRALGGSADEVSSPTFVLVQSYPCAGGEVAVVHHVDLYRLRDDEGSLREIGLEEFLSETDAVVVVEWPRSALERLLPAGCRWWRVTFTHAGGDSRTLRVTPSP